MHMARNAKIIYLFLFFLAIYLLPGIYGHTPWKQDENYTFGVIQAMYDTGNWLVPMNAGEPFMEKPPLYYWTATLSARLLSGLLPLHDAARSASLLFSALNMIFFVLLARRFFKIDNLKDNRIWLAFALYVCAPGVLRHSHDMFSDTALTAGATIGLYGILGIIQQKQIRSSLLFLCTGTVVSMLSKGIFVPGVLWLTVFLSPLFLPACRTRNFWQPCVIAGLISVIFILPWPVLLYLKHPDLFFVWFWENNIGRFVGFSVSELGAKANHTRIPEAIIFFAFPSGILAAFSFFSNPLKKLFISEEYPVTFFLLLGLIILQLSASSRALYLLPFIAPMALLGAQFLPSMNSFALRFISRFSGIFWSLMIILLWVLYTLKITGYHQESLIYLNRWLPASYTLHFSFLPFSFACCITLLWFSHMWLVKIQCRALQAISRWALGATTAWGLVFTLLVGWVDYTKGYEGVFTNLKIQLDRHYTKDDCMASFHIGESEAPMLYYFTRILHQPQHTFAKPKTCRWLIVLTDEALPAPEDMKFFWSGNRPGDKHHNLVVYEAMN